MKCRSKLQRFENINHQVFTCIVTYMDVPKFHQTELEWFQQVSGVNFVYFTIISSAFCVTDYINSIHHSQAVWKLNYLLMNR